MKKILVVDVGGSHVKVLLSGEKEPRKFKSGPAMTPSLMVRGVKKITRDWRYDVITLGYPGVVVRNKPTVDPVNLAPGWIGVDFEKKFRCPVKVVNDAAMQAIGAYEGGKMLFLGLGTGLGSALIVEGVIVPMELGHLPYRSATFEDYVGERGLLRFGKARWRRYVADAIARLIAALEPEDIVIGGGNGRLLKTLPPACRLGTNANAFAGGFQLWKRRH
jgi:polyphosphate glucokinase